MKKSIIIIGVSIILFSSCSETKKESKDINTNDIPVTLSHVNKTTYSRNITSYGVVSTENEVRLSFKTAGIIKRLSVKEGDRFYKGQVLAELDMTEVSAQISNTHENLEKTERDYKRVLNLHRDSVASTEQLQNAKTQLNIATKVLQVAQYNHDHSVIKASFGGVVTKRFFNEGEIVGAGITVIGASLDGDDSLIIKVGLTANEWNNITKGDRATILCDAYPDINLKGSVYTISQSGDPVTGLYQVEIKLVSNKVKLTVGMFAEVTIHPSKDTEYFTIPVSCLTDADKKRASVYIPDNNTVKKIPVEIVFIQGGTAYISGGLENIQQVINEGAGFLTEKSNIVLHKDDK